MSDLNKKSSIDYESEIANLNAKHKEEVSYLKNKIDDLNDEIDGLVTNKTNISLATTNADCILLLFFDPVKKVIANVHSGWRGTLQRISIEAVNKMKDEYGCNPEDIICCICPSIRKCHFKVHKDVQEPFYNEFKDLKEIDERKTTVIQVSDEAVNYSIKKATSITGALLKRLSAFSTDSFSLIRT